jgi:hypothetical protein
MVRLIERAFELARSGKYRVLEDLDHALREEGFTIQELSQSIHMRATRDQLRAIMAAARPHN